jgi:hypothetical protein
MDRKSELIACLLSVTTAMYAPKGDPLDFLRTVGLEWTMADVRFAMEEALNSFNVKTAGWFDEDWRGLEVYLYGTGPCGRILGPAGNVGFVQVGWAQGCSHALDQSLHDLENSDGRPFYVP